MAGLDECQGLNLNTTVAIGKTFFSANSFYRVVFYDPIKHFSMKKSKNKV